MWKGGTGRAFVLLKGVAPHLERAESDGLMAVSVPNTMEPAQVVGWPIHAVRPVLAARVGRGFAGACGCRRESRCHGQRRGQPTVARHYGGG